MRVGTTLHSDSLTLIYLQRRGRVYVSYNCRSFSENNVNNWNIFENFTKNFWRLAANIDLYTFKIRSMQKQFHCQQFPHVMKFLLADKGLSKPREKPCQTHWMGICWSFQLTSCLPLPLSDHLAKRLQGVTFCILSFLSSIYLLSLFHSFTMQMFMANVRSFEFIYFVEYNLKNLYNFIYVSAFSNVIHFQTKNVISHLYSLKSHLLFRHFDLQYSHLEENIPELRNCIIEFTLFLQLLCKTFTLIKCKSRLFTARNLVSLFICLRGKAIGTPYPYCNLFSPIQYNMASTVSNGKNFYLCNSNEVTCLHEVTIYPCICWETHRPNSCIHVSVGDLYIPTIGLPILHQENRWTDRGNI